MQVFIAYALPDQHFARQVATLLTRSGLNVWIDIENVYPGDNLYKSIGAALESSDAMVVVVSPEAVESRELEGAVGFGISSINFKDRMIPVEVRPTEKIPTVLKHLGPISSNGNAVLASHEIVQRLTSTVEKAH